MVSHQLLEELDQSCEDAIEGVEVLLIPFDARQHFRHEAEGGCTCT